MSIKNKLLLFLVFIHPFNSILAQQADTKSLTILYTNDLHAHVEPLKVGWISETRKVGGFANIATLVKQEKKANPDALYLDAGDYFTGPSISYLTKGEAIIDILNYMPLDATCIGNHEFDHGWQNVIEQFNKAKFPILNGNIFIKKTGKLIWNHPCMILKRNGIKIGLIGLHGKFAFYDTTSDEMIQGVEARDELVYLQKYIKQLKNKVDIVVLLVHEGIPGRQSSQGSTDVARNLQTDIDLAQKISGVDVMITGHAHQGTPQALISNGTIIVSTDALGVELGKLEIKYDKKQDKITGFTNQLNYVFDDEIEDDSTTSKVIDKWKNQLEKITEQKVCTTSEPLTRSYGEESFLGDIVADAMLYTYPKNDFAITNSGGLRQDVAGPLVTVGNLISAFPFPNTVVQIEMKGEDIKDLFEHGAKLTNGILQVSKGVEMRYDDSLPIGNRVISCKINGQPLDPNKTYKFLTSNFLADGGDGFLAFKKAIVKKNTYTSIIQTMTEYLKTFEVYKPQLYGRVVKVNK